MVEKLTDLDILSYPQTTELNKWVLGIELPHTIAKENAIAAVSIMYAASISLINFDNYIVHYTQGDIFKQLYNSNNIRQEIQIEKTDGNLILDDCFRLYVSDNYEELLSFVKNVIDVHLLLKH